MRHSFILILSFLLLPGSKAQTQDIIWTSFDTSRKIDIKNFSILTKPEIDFAKNFPAFKDNRARLTLTDGSNRISPKELQKPGFPLFCECAVEKDTVHIKTAVGLMSGLGITMALYKNQFAATFFQETDNTPVLKLKQSDTSYLDRISVSAEEQKLTLYKKPSFMDAETIIGAFEGKFRKFYELDFGTKPPLTRNYKAKIFFKCRLHSARN